MRPHTMAVGACVALTGCIVQSPPAYWGNPYAQGYYPSPNTQANVGRAPSIPPAPISQAPYSPQPEATYSSPVDSRYSPPPRDDSEASPAGNADSETPSEPRNPRATFADEAIDYGVPPTNMIRERDFDAPTPVRIQGANTITTLDLQTMLASDRPPLLIDVIRGAQSVSLPHSIWLRDAGTGRHLDDDIQAWFDMQLANLTDRDKSRPLVIFCASRMCWLAHNATLRAVDLGYTNVYWYRGGRDSWQAAGLPMAPVAQPPS